MHLSFILKIDNSLQQATQKYYAIFILFFYFRKYFCPERRNGILKEFKPYLLESCSQSAEINRIFTVIV